MMMLPRRAAVGLMLVLSLSCFPKAHHGFLHVPCSSRQRPRRRTTQSIFDRRKSSLLLRSMKNHRSPLLLEAAKVDEKDLDKDGGASIPALSVSLVKSIVGGGVLALPASVAVLGNSPEVLVPASIIIIAIGLINGYFFSLIGRVCAQTGATGYRDAWEKTVGCEEGTDQNDDNDESSSSSSSSSRLVAGVVVVKTGLSCLAYSMILADSFQSLALSAGLDDVTRTQALEAVTVFALLPLCLLRNISSLTPFSLLGLGGILFTITSMIIRYFDGSYSTTSLMEPPEIMTESNFHIPTLDESIEAAAAAAESVGSVIDESVAAVSSTLISFVQDAGLSESSIPHFLTTAAATSTPVVASSSSAAAALATPVDISPDGIAVLVCTLATAFVAHYNAPRFYTELSNNTINRFNVVVALAYAISAISFIVVSVTGFLTFGSISSGLILNNYSSQDPLMTLSRAAVAFSLTFTYPLPFVGFRDGVLAVLREAFASSDEATATLAQQKSSSSSSSSSDITNNDSIVTIISLLLLGSVTLGAAMVEDLKLVLAVGGGTFSTTVASVFPAIMFRSAMVQKHKEQDKKSDRKKSTIADAAAARARRQRELLEVNFVTALMGLSIAIGATGVYRALETAAMNQ